MVGATRRLSRPRMKAGRCTAWSAWLTKTLRRIYGLIIINCRAAVAVRLLITTLFCSSHVVIGQV